MARAKKAVAPEADPQAKAVEVEPILDQRDVAAQVQQDAVANRIAGDQRARSGDRHIVIGPGGVRFSIEELHMDVRYPLANDALVLADPVQYGLIKPGCHKPGYRYLWPKRLADSTANMIGGGIYELVPSDETQPVPGAGISKITLPNGDTGVAWKGHVMVRMSPENYDRYINYWEKLSWQRQIRQTGSPLEEKRGVVYEAKIEDKRQETVLIPT
jgi:hypothetical protein